MIHRCSGCLRLYEPTPGDGALPLRCDAIIIALGTKQVDRANVEGSWRHRNVERFGKQTKWIDRNDKTAAADIANHSEAAGAELAVAVALGLPWTDEQGESWKPGSRRLDVDPYDVRFTRVEPPGLIVRERDLRRDRRQVIVLVTGAMPVFTLRGWARVEEAAQRSYHVAAVPPYWSMPARDLHDLRRLPEIRARQQRIVEVLDDVPDEALV